MSQRLLFKWQVSLADFFFFLFAKPHIYLFFPTARVLQLAEAH